ncbi:hypothetical protein BKA62DRAFT_774638 [Auriculariales sp. MPI-PUGE-AT-0066]|nr:hypothetical protein BKA62DRAFT_774638 [Auriculariales sp. MPI-PUGE-AT-0066]
MVVVASMGLAMGLYFLAKSLRQPIGGYSTFGWYLLIPTNLLMMAQHIVSIAAGSKELLGTNPLPYRYFNDKWPVRGLVSQSLFDIFLAAVLRVAFWEVVSGTNVLAKRRAAKISFIVVDVILGAALIGSMGGQSTFSLGGCVEYGCDNPTHISMVSFWNASFGYGFPAILFLMMIFIIVCNTLAVLWIRRVNILSPLAVHMSRSGSATVGLWLVTGITFISVAGSDGGYSVWRGYYSSISYWVAQVVALGALQHILRRNPFWRATPTVMG